MATMLSTKIRYARKAAGLTQAQVAEQLGITRGAVTQWESKDEANRTNPSTETLRRIAQVTGMPFTWFVDDKLMATDVHHYRNLYQNNQIHEIQNLELKAEGGDSTMMIHQGTYIEPLGTIIPVDSTDLTVPKPPRLATAFWISVEFKLCQNKPELLKLFAARFSLGGESFSADFATSDVLAAFESFPGGVTRVDYMKQWTRRKVADLLLLEKAIPRSVQKYLLVWLSSNEDPPPELAQFAKAAGVELLYFRDPDIAAGFLAKLIKP